MSATMRSEEFIEFYDAFADRIFKHCYFRLYNRERAREIMQEAFLRAWQYNIDGKEIRNLKALMYTIATHLIIDDVRKKKEVSLDAMTATNPNDPFASGDSIHWEPSVDTKEVLWDTIDGHMAMEALEGLDDSYREVIVMRYIDGSQPSEIAKILDETPNVISVRLHRAIEKLKTLILKKK